MAQNNNHAQVAPANPYTQSYYSPDTLFAPKPDADSSSAHDSAYALLDMAQATVVALMANGDDEKEGFTLNHKLVISLLWSIDTQIGLVKSALIHMAEADRAAWLAAKAQGGAA